MLFRDAFNKPEKGDYGLTEMAVYQSLAQGDDLIPLYGGNASHDNASQYVSQSGKTLHNQRITVFSGEGVVLSLDGSAGSMTYKRDETFALNHHACFLTLSKDGEMVVSLRFFAMFFQNRLRSIAVGTGSKTLSLQQLDNFEFELPPIETQLAILEKIDSLRKAIAPYEYAAARIDSLIARKLAGDYSEYQAREVPVSQLFEYASGNSGLTEELIYNASTTPGQRYTVLSGATISSNAMGLVPRVTIRKSKTDQLLKVFSDTEGILVVRKGKAGTMKHLPPGKYVINDDAYILYLKDKAPFKVSLEWFALQYKNLLFSYASHSANGTFSITRFFEDARIDVPAYDDQLNILSAVKKAQGRSSSLHKANARLSSLLSRELSL